MDFLSEEEKAHDFIGALSHIFLALKLKLANNEGRMRLINTTTQAGKVYVELNGFFRTLDMAVGLAKVQPYGNRPNQEERWHDRDRAKLCDPADLR